MSSFFIGVNSKAIIQTVDKLLFYFYFYAIEPSRERDAARHQSDH